MAGDVPRVGVGLDGDIGVWEELDHVVKSLLPQDETECLSGSQNDHVWNVNKCAMQNIRTKPHETDILD